MAKRMEIGAVIGASPKENVIRETPMPGDAIVLLGGRTGRDGCGGATGSSKAHTEQSIETCGAEVQKGNPPTERKIQRLFRDGEVAKLIKRCNDFGAGGVCVAIGELADGLTVDLDRVSKKYEGLDGTELAISESQERMAVVLDPKDVPAFLQAAHQENLEAQQVAEVTENPRLKMNWRGDLIVDLSREFLNTNGVTQRAKAKITAVDPAEDYRHLAPKALRDLPVGKAFEENLKRLEVCSQKGLSERFDSSIGAGTVLMPFSGKYQLTPEEAMVAKIPLLKGETDDPRRLAISGYFPWSHGAAYAVVESLSKLLAVGADPAAARLTFQEYFERLHDVPERWGKPAAALLGAFTAQVNMGNPAIGGKDSMSGSFEALDVPPTLVSFAVAMTKASKTVSACFRKAGSQAWMVPVPENPETHLPAWDKLKAVYAKIYEMMGKDQILSASVVREGGAAAAVCRMCFGNQMGFQFAGDPDQKTLFAPLSGSLVLELKDDSDTTGLETLGASVLGAVCGEPVILIGSERLSLAALTEAWEKPLEKVFPTRAETKAYFCQVPLYSERNQKAPAVQYAKPRVFIPAFPGTNCEVDTARAFERAGAKADVLIVKNLTPADIEETIEAMVKAIQNAQIIM
ncbi:MAG: phosphoribosylformylglycinamidine synthase subunit PurQ, partial [[Clostridium] leptum]